ncbi:MAG: uracil-DNA glycosylase [Massiliimalia sp.]|jgi:uracil-DNA glycosylase family 4
MHTWEELNGFCLQCRRCPLWETRTQVIVGEGDPHAIIMLVGEAPGEQEDLIGRPFVGPSGQLLSKMLASVGLKREKIYLTNVVKCRPPQNREPRAKEQEACLHYLRYQVRLIKPKIIVCLGRVAAQALIDPKFRITKEHGVWQEEKGFWMMATYHPSALLRYPEHKPEAYEDLKSLRAKLEEVESSMRQEL